MEGCICVGLGEHRLTMTQSNERVRLRCLWAMLSAPPSRSLRRQYIFCLFVFEEVSECYGMVKLCCKKKTK
ncbi:hypothetical protein EGR_09160 [Echinococcus granulosus]|uniref:Uncharacterized protein n=1 Tax=Echinococcus granulosus TaxID=6210 RepID=W6U6M8_ECHGR|nr:hypothetical protein EGR_09160 [Echinococcus granulosus]EUB55996.1 hypothetical protein EGR_09160 [Echinococcus granulosus]